MALIKNYSLSGMHDEAIAKSRQAITIAEQEFGKTDEAIIPILEAYADALVRAKKAGRSKESQRANEINS